MKLTGGVMWRHETRSATMFKSFGSVRFFKNVLKEVSNAHSFDQRMVKYTIRRNIITTYG